MIGRATLYTLSSEIVINLGQKTIKVLSSTEQKALAQRYKEREEEKNHSQSCCPHAYHHVPTMTAAPASQGDHPCRPALRNGILGSFSAYCILLTCRSSS